MSIDFQTIPQNWRIPGTYVEIRPGQNSNGAMVVPPKILLVGQKLAAGTAPANVAKRVYSADEVGSLAGRGSMLHHMAIKSFKNAPFVPTYILPLADGAGTKSTRSFGIVGTATQAGALYAYVGDTLYQLNVAVGATGAQLATALAALIQADTDRYADAAVDGATTTQVNVTARHAGIDAGVIPVAINRHSTQSTPNGITVTIGNASAGTVNPSLSTAVASLGDEWYPSVVAPYTDSTGLDVIKTEMLDRWGATRAIDGQVFTYFTGTVSDGITFATARNDYTLAPIDTSDCLTPPWAVVAAASALDAAEPDPARPRQTLILAGVLAKSRAGRRTKADRNNLINGGVGTLKVNEDGSVAVEYLTTSYRTNTYGAPDLNYFDVENLRTVSCMRYSSVQRFDTKYPRSKLGPDGSIGENVVTPLDALAEYSDLYDAWMAAGWAKGGEAKARFLKAAAAVISTTDPNRLDSIITPQLMNGLRVNAISLQFQRA